MIGKLRRLLGLYRLLWVEDRLRGLEEKLARSQSNSQRRIQILQDQNARLQKRLQASQNQVTRLQKRVKSRFENIDEQIELVKSSADVPPEYIEEFFKWKTENPLPERPLVTVAVATYNRARLLTERCIPSVLGQTYENLELIVVGDGCTDETEELLAGIDDPRLTFVNISSRDSYPDDPARRWMVAGTRPTNKALSLVRGDFVTHLDDDDEYLPERLEKLVRFATKENCDFVWHPYWRETNHGDWHLEESREFVRGQITNGAVLYRSWFARIDSRIDAHRLMEPGDWNRFRRMNYIYPSPMRYPEPLLKKYG